MNLRVLSILGTRPEAIKLAPVILQLAKTDGIESTVCVTAQHRQMLDQVLDLFDITPDVDLNLMSPNQSLATISSDIFSSLDPVIKEIDPHWVLVQGDTTTVMVASLLTFYNHIRLGHIEAGLRTGDKNIPFPEEINRRITSLIADLHFAPTQWARRNLIHEGISPDTVLVTGNPVIDAIQSAAEMPAPGEISEVLDRLDIMESSSQPDKFTQDNFQRRLILVTAHRRENFGEPLVEICNAIRILAGKYSDSVTFLYPVHPNPNVSGPVYRMLYGIPNVALVSPMDYLPFIHLLKRATIVLTDSGGLQEEAPGFGIPVLVLRTVTERPEGIEAGTVKLVGTDCELIVAETSRLLDNPSEYKSMALAVNPYGDGHSAERIVDGLIKYGDSIDNLNNQFQSKNE
jgi:UDP-N-acetylglucosamine 2-epimerase (non-hydrolysing)